MRVGDCLAQLYIYTRFANLGRAIFIGTTHVLCTGGTSIVAVRTAEPLIILDMRMGEEEEEEE